MKVIITGAGGQLAYELQQTQPANVDVVAVSRKELDITDASAVERFLNAQKPNAIINAAAYTAVDKAEDDKDTAYRVNEQGIANLAKYSAKDCYIVHVSTDFVFDGAKNIPYMPDDSPSPQSVYGSSKLAGEQALSANKEGAWTVIRTAWVYSSHGNNFVKSMLRFMAERPKLNIVVDQVGTPTWARGLAEACWQALEHKIQGVYHWSDAGVASWYDFAEAIRTLGKEYGLLETASALTAIPTSGYPLPAPRPAFSVLDKRKILEDLPALQNIHWYEQLRLMMKELSEK